MKANKGFKTTKKHIYSPLRGFLTFLVILHLYGDYPHCSLLARKLNKQNKLRTTTTTTLYSVYPVLNPISVDLLHQCGTRSTDCEVLEEIFTETQEIIE